VCGFVAAAAAGEEGDFLGGGREVDDCSYCVREGNCGYAGEGEGLLSVSETTRPGWQAATPRNEARMREVASGAMKCLSVDALASYLR